MNLKSNVHIKMTPEERAKQFMPFSALKGYEEALRAKEIEMEALLEQEKEKIEDDFVREE